MAPASEVGGLAGPALHETVTQPIAPATDIKAELISFGDAVWNSRLSAIAIFVTLLFAPMGAQAMSTSIDFGIGSDPVSFAGDEYASQGVTIAATEDGMATPLSLKLTGVMGTDITGYYLSAGELADLLQTTITLSFEGGVTSVSFDYATLNGALFMSSPDIGIPDDAIAGVGPFGSLFWGTVSLAMTSPIFSLDIHELATSELILDNLRFTRAIPEPGAALLFGIGAIGTGLRLRGARRTSTRS